MAPRSSLARYLYRISRDYFSRGVKLLARSLARCSEREREREREREVGEGEGTGGAGKLFHPGREKESSE